jgi:hypothetical protein
MNHDFIIVWDHPKNGRIYWSGRGGWAATWACAHHYDTRGQVEAAIKRQDRKWQSMGYTTWTATEGLGYMTMEDLYQELGI